MDHLKADDTPKDKAVSAGMGMASQMQAPQAPQGPQMPQGMQGMPQGPMGASQGQMMPNGPVAPSTADFLSGAGMGQTNPMQGM